jgi:hypothetical protein
MQKFRMFFMEELSVDSVVSNIKKGRLCLSFVQKLKQDSVAPIHGKTPQLFKFAAQTMSV